MPQIILKFEQKVNHSAQIWLSKVRKRVKYSHKNSILKTTIMTPLVLVLFTESLSHLHLNFSAFLAPQLFSDCYLAPQSNPSPNIILYLTEK